MAFDQTSRSLQKINALLATGAVAGGGFYVVDTFAAMKAIVTVGMTLSQVTIRGLAAAYDGGGGLYVWGAASVAADDGISVATPTDSVGAGRWIKLL